MREAAARLGLDEALERLPLIGLVANLAAVRADRDQASERVEVPTSMGELGCGAVKLEQIGNPRRELPEHGPGGGVEAARLVVEQEQGAEIAEEVFTAALSVDSSSTPYGLVITYGIEKYLGKDKRRRTGELYARRFDGRNWQSDPVLISQPQTIYNWYPNVNQDASHGLCVLYSRSIDEDNLGAPLAAMTTLVTNIPSTPSDSSTSRPSHNDVK